MINDYYDVTTFLCEMFGKNSSTYLHILFLTGK